MKPRSDDDLVYDGELGWIDPEPDQLLESIGIKVSDLGTRYLYMDDTGLNLVVHKDADLARLRACIDDAEWRISTQAKSARK